MGQYLSGQHGKLLIKKASDTGGAVEVGSLKSWSINQTMDVLDTTTMGSTDRTILHGVRSFTGSASLLYYQENNSNVREISENTFPRSGKSNTATDDYGQNTEPALSYLVLRAKAGSTSYDLTCNVFITGLTITCSVGEVLSADITFEGHGLPVSNNLIT